MAMLFVLPGVASGHAFPDHSDPRVGATVSGSPPSVRIWFDSDLEPLFSKMVVKDSSGKEVDKKDSHVDPSNDALLIVDVAPLPPGTYHVYWNVVARDTHRTEGDFTFTVK
jgi:methionine-rich copper-binding protein CopC